MNLPDIAIINFSSMDDDEVQAAVRSVNRQVVEDFMPVWGSGYLCKLHAVPFDIDHPTVLEDQPVPAEAVIYLVDQPHVAGALGYHDMNNAEIPVGFVFTDLDQWTVTLSHEVLELIVDPTVNILVPGRDPRAPGDPNAWLFHTYEVCDAVERTTYEIDDIAVSNFVTPVYFREGDSPGTRNDFLGIGVDSFGLLPGCHLGVLNPTTGDWETILAAATPTPTRLNERRQAAYSKRPLRERPAEKQEQMLIDYKAKPIANAAGLPLLQGITRTQRHMAKTAKFAEMLKGETIPAGH